MSFLLVYGSGSGCSSGLGLIYWAGDNSGPQYGRVRENGLKSYTENHRLPTPPPQLTRLRPIHSPYTAIAFFLNRGIHHPLQVIDYPFHVMYISHPRVYSSLPTLPSLPAQHFNFHSLSILLAPGPTHFPVLLAPPGDIPLTNSSSPV